MRRNVLLLSFIVPSIYSWFWSGVWMLYYLRFTNYEGVGLIEIVVVVSGFLLEVPTGAIADIFGKKKTIFAGILFNVIGNIVMASANTLSHLILSILFLGLGFALLSGTIDALLFDSLKQIQKESTFAREKSKIETYRLVVLALCSVIGGFSYLLHPRLPFILTTFSMAIGLLFAFLLTEPKIDTEKSNLRSFGKIILEGFQALKNIPLPVQPWVILLLVITSFGYMYEMAIDGALAIKFQLSASVQGVLWAFIPLLASAVALLYSKFPPTQRKERYIAGLLFVIMLASVFVSPFLTLLLGALTITIRAIFYPIFNVVLSDIVNQVVASKYRATTLSILAMFEKLPYVFVAVWIGRTIDNVGAFRVGTYTSLSFLLLSIVPFIWMIVAKMKNQVK